MAENKGTRPVYGRRASTQLAQQGHTRDSRRDQHLRPARMASELSQLIESELRKAEGANKPDEHQRRLTSLRVKTGLEQPPPTLFQRVCTTKRQVIAAGVVTSLLLILIIYAAASHRHHTTSPDSTHKQQSEGNNKVVGASGGNLQAPPASHTRAKADSIAGTPEAVTDQPSDDLTNPAAERPEHKHTLNSHSQVAPTQATAPAPSQDVYKSAPALGPTGAESPSQSTSAVPAPAPTDVR